MKSKFYYPYLKFGLWSALAFFLLTALTAIILRLSVKQSDVEKWVQRAVFHQTGGKLEFKVEHFDILNHISIRNISFTGPNSDLGAGNESELAKDPLLRIDHIEIIPKLTSLWRGVAKIKKFSITRPQFYLSLAKADDNLTGLLKYRAKNFPPKATTTPWYELPKLPFKLDQIFIPAAITLDEFQLSNLEIKFSNDNLVSFLGPITLNAKAYAAGKKMQFSGGLNGIATTFDLQLKGKSYSWMMALDNTFRLNSWTEFELKGKNSLKGSYLKQPLKNDYQLQGKISSDLSGIHFKDIALDITKTLKIEGYAELKAKNHELLNIQSSAELKGALDLDNPLTNTLTELIGLKAEGKADFAIKVNGDNQIDENYIPKQLAQTKILINLKDINIIYAKLIELRNLKADSSLLVDSNKEDIVLQPTANISFEKFNVNIEDLSLQLKHLKTKVQSSYSITDLKLSDMQLTSDIENVGINFQNKNIIQEPFHFGLNAGSKSNFSDLVLNGEGNLGKLITMGLDARCFSPCSRFTVKSRANAEKLTSLMELVRSKVSLQFKKFVPSYFEGIAGVDFNISFDRPNFHAWNGVEKLNIDWQVKANISNLDMKLPFYSTALDGFNLLLLGQGKADQGIIKTNASLGLINLVPTPSLTIGLRKNTFNSETKLKITDLGKLPSSLSSSSEWSLGNEQIELKTGQVFRDNFLSGMLTTKGVSDLSAELKNVSLIGGGLSSRLRVKGDLQAKVLESNFTFSFHPEFLGRYIKGLKSSGFAEFNGELNLKNWDQLSLSATANFNKLSSTYNPQISIVSEANIAAMRTEDAQQASLNGNLNTNNNFLKVGFMDGSFPILINEKISDMLRWFEKDNSLRMREKIRSYLATDEKLTEISLPENNLVAWKDASTSGKNYLKIRDLLLNGVGLNELDVALEVSSKAIMLKNYTASFLNGKLEGSAFIPLSPVPERIMIASHVLGIDSALVPRLLGKTMGKKKAEPISGNFHLDYFVRTSLIDGVFDLTSIGADQMLYLIELIDPDHADPAMNNVRRALAIGSLKKAKATIKRGELALDLDVRVASLPIPLPSLGGIKVSNIIDNLKDDLFAKKVSE